MERIEIDYQGLEGVHPAYRQKLIDREPAFQNALRTLGHATSVVWLYDDDGNHNYLFRLVDSADREFCILRVSPLDLTLDAEAFEELLIRGKRPCVVSD
ncbi:MAG: hypothetical protein ABFC96_06475 [Thermoguttaceae bacterium]